MLAEIGQFSRLQSFAFFWAAKDQNRRWICTKFRGFDIEICTSANVSACDIDFVRKSCRGTMAAPILCGGG
ncbi:MAG: hypothetical protein V4532_02590 [Pseudomonadota bacterium]